MERQEIADRGAAAPTHAAFGADAEFVHCLSRSGYPPLRAGNAVAVMELLEDVASSGVARMERC